MNNPPGNPFQDFSLHLYGRPAVQRLCLTLQDGHQADVNLLLFLLWRDACGAAPPELPEIDAMIAMVAPVRAHVIEPLRGLRRHMKQPLPDDLPELREALRQRLLAAELAAEFIAQGLLYTHFPLEGRGPAANEAAESLGRYLGRIGMDRDAARDAARALAEA